MFIDCLILPQNLSSLPEYGMDLVVAGSPVLHLLGLLSDKGVRLTVCSTYLNFYGLTDQVAVGRAGTMVEIVEAQARADKVITL